MFLWVFALCLRNQYFYVTIAGDFERFQYFNFEINFLKNEKKHFTKNWSNFLYLKILRLKIKHFHTKLQNQYKIDLLQRTEASHDLLFLKIYTEFKKLI